MDIPAEACATLLSIIFRASADLGLPLISKCYVIKMKFKRVDSKLENIYDRCTRRRMAQAPLKARKGAR